MNQTKIAGGLAIVALILLLASFIPWPPGPGDGEASQPAGADTISLVDQGRALFLAKGCITCHQHDAWSEQSGPATIGPDLSNYQPDPEYVARWLRDPAAIKPRTQMPDLALSDEEIEALIAFMDAAAAGESCPVTQPPRLPFTPPDTGTANELDEAYFWYGSNALWTQLPRDGVWRDLPHNERGYTQKIFFSRQGYDWIEEPLPALTLSGRRLDGDGQTFEEPEATNGFHPDVGSFMLIGVDIPTEGCWEITGHYQGHELSFVVWVEPA
ncbi:MAG: c-type cytochrome [Chloroflexota bacterium]|jgi:mono/diheme cytochrome c family protein